MNKILVIISAAILLAACSPSPQAIQTAIAQTQVAGMPASTSTPTLAPMLTSTPTLISTPEPVVLYSDDFSNSQSGWDQMDSQDLRWMYSGGQYVMSDGWGWLYNCANRNLTDAVLTVDVIHVTGDIEYTGSIINWLYNDHGSQSPDNGYYSLRLFGDGYLTIEKYSGADFQQQILYDKTFNAAIYLERHTNHIAIAFGSGTSAVYINDKYVTSIQDSTYTTGDFCLGAFSTDAHPVEIAYDNLVIYTIDSWTPPK